MRLKAASSSNSCICVTLRYVVDAARDITIPAGVALCQPDLGYLLFRLPEPGEQVEGLPLVRSLPSLRHTTDLIESWYKSGSLPYQTEKMQPLNHQWWGYIQEILEFNVRIGAISLIDCTNIDDSIDAQYEAIVRPVISKHERVQRIDRAIKQALGDVSKRFHKGEVPAYGGRSVSVMRQASGKSKRVIVDAVNLASRSAEQDTDELSGKLLRIKDGHEQQDIEVRFLLGYKASPHGLNGERPLIEFVEKKFDTKMYDLDNDKSEFKKRAEQELQALEPDEGLFRSNP